MDELSAAFEPVRQIWREANWPGVVEELSYGTPALKVRGKLLLRLREPGVVVVHAEQEEKEFLMASAPEIYFDTDHYKGWPWILARLEAIDPEELRDRIERTWRTCATKKMISEFEA